MLGALGWALAIRQPAPMAEQATTGPEHLQLVPGEAAGQVSIGMTLEDCERILGRADLSEDMEDGRLVSWNGLGVSVQLAKGPHPLRKSEEDSSMDMVASILVQADRYQTGGGLHVGSPVGDVERVLGPGAHHNGLIAYPHRGIDFIVNDQAVQQILIYQKTGDEP